MSCLTNPDMKQICSCIQGDQLDSLRSILDSSSRSAAELWRCLQGRGCFSFPEQQAKRECSFNQEGACMQKAKQKAPRQQHYYKIFKGQS